MLMLQSITPAINVKNSGNKLLFKFSSLFLLHCTGQPHLLVFTVWYSSSTAYAANGNSKKENMFHVYSHGIAG